MKSLFRVPLRVHHGILLMTYLAANYEAGTPVSLEEIALREKISQGYLEEIANDLRTAELIQGKRGQKGGYILQHNPRNITIATILNAIEGPVTLVDCLADSNPCPSEHGCSNRLIWQRVQERLNQTLESITLYELATERYALNHLPTTP